MQMRLNQQHVGRMLAQKTVYARVEWLALGTAGQCHFYRLHRSIVKHCPFCYVAPTKSPPKCSRSIRSLPPSLLLRQTTQH